MDYRDLTLQGPDEGLYWIASETRREAVDVSPYTNADAGTDVVVEELTHEEGREMLNGLTRDRLHIGVDEFLANLDAGEYDGTDEEFLLKLIMLEPFAR
jgi:hypothetical protein